MKKIQITETFPSTLEEYYMLLHYIIKDLRAMLYLVEVATVYKRHSEEVLNKGYMALQPPSLDDNKKNVNIFSI